MKKTLSSNYLLNRYSYYTYFLFYAVFLIRIKLNEWVLLKDDIKSLVIINIFYVLWFFCYGSFHFSDQTCVTRIDYRTLKFAKGRKAVEITKSDIDKIFIQKITGIKTGGKHWYKVLVITKDYEKYRFTYVSELKYISSSDWIESFIYETENFWGVADKNMIRKSPDIFFCN